jgi:predicted membrane-bound spermidine synthase
VVAFGTGLSSFLYEVGWIRLLSMILGSATHSFEVMLSAFIFGMALGGFWVRKRMDKFRRPELVLAVVQLVMGVSAIATLPAYWLAVNTMGAMMGDEAPKYAGWITDWLSYLAGGDGERPGPFAEVTDRTDDRTVMLWYVFNVLRYLLCLLIMLPATFCAGMTLPLLTHVMLKRGQPESAVGNVYGVNTLGAIAGAVTGGLILMPLVKLKGLIVLGALVDLMLGLVLIRAEIFVGRGNRLTPRLLRRAAMGTLFVTAAGLLFPIDPMMLTSTVYRHGRTKLPDHYELLSYIDGRTATVSVVANTEHEGYHVIYTNGKPDASIVLERWPEDRDPLDGPDIAGDEPNQFLVGLVPLMAKPEATTAALIGFGSGVTCHTMLGSPNLERLDTVEIEPEMVRGSRYFMPVNYRAYQDPRSHIFFDDAKAYFAAAGLEYDFIVSEPTNPWVSGVSSLFTVEFYQEVKLYLKPGGVLAQWIQGYELSDELLISVLSALDHEFEDYLVVRIGSRDWVILSSPDGQIGALSDIPLSWPGTKESFDLLGIHDQGQIDGLIVANRRMLHPFLQGRKPNRDSHPILDTGAERERFLRSSAEFLHSVRWTPAPLLDVLGGIERRPYPMQGIGDLRDPHILYENEQAVFLMRRYADPDVRTPATLSGATMAHWRDMLDELDSTDGWRSWLNATYEIYKETASHYDVHLTPWWTHVKQVAARKEAPSDVKLVIELLDALSARDGKRLWPLVKQALPREEFALPTALLTIAGVVALELEGAGAAERKAFVEEYMMDIGNGSREEPPASEDLAYQVIRAYAARDD